MSEEAVQNNEEVEEGAPAWVVTFGDLMSLLLCFFVLLLSFSEMDKAKYKNVAGSLKKAFGVQRKQPFFESPKGMKMIAKDFDQELIPTKERLEFIATQEKEAMGEELKKEIELSFKDIKDSIHITAGEDQITISLMGEAAFAVGKANIKKQSKPLIKTIGVFLNKIDGDIVIAGHTDNIPVIGGQYKSNLKLSIARAATVAEFLISESSVEPERIATMGFGEYRPKESNDTKDGRRKNRRVEIILENRPLKKTTEEKGKDELSTQNSPL